MEASNAFASNPLIAAGVILSTAITDAASV
jgi:hypothetical protein